MALVADIFKALIIDGDGDVIAKENLSTANLSVETETNDVIAGRNDLISILHGRREIAIDFETPEFDLKTLAKHVGNDIVTGEGTAWAMPSWKTAENLDTEVGITLDETPINDADLVIKDASGNKIDNENILLSGQEVTFSSEVSAGDDVQVVTYKYNTPAETQTIDIDSTKFPKDVRVVLQTLKIDNDEQPVSYLQFEYPRVKPSADFSFETASAREASTNSMSFRVLKPKTSDKIGKISEIPINSETSV